jgi:hypothetical protein
MNIQLLKFTTGEETVFEVVSENADTITVKNGLTMVFDGSAIRAVPFTVNVDEGQEITVSQDDLIFITEPRKDLKEQYKQQFSTIITPDTGIITKAS